MWIDTNEGLINLDKAERIALVDKMNIHIFSSRTELLAALQFPSADEAEAEYKKIQIKVGVTSAPLTAADIIKSRNRSDK